MAETVIGVVGLGYVGLPLAVAFSEKFKVIGYDVNATRLAELRRGYDRTGEVSCGNDDHNPLLSHNLVLTDDSGKLAEASFYIVTVPTPIDSFNKPDMRALVAASETIGRILKPGDCVVYESTVYPGATEEICLPILEAFSGLKGGVDFDYGYSPERINPGDKEHSFTTISKVVSGCHEAACHRIRDAYAAVINAAIHVTPTVKVAEAAKVIENIQRDVNIALVNELALLFDRLDIDTLDVLAAAGTKWNFLPFKPGLVGGHCIGVDPYYLTHKAEQVGYHPQVILAGRRINNYIPEFVVYRSIQELTKLGKSISGANVLVFGLAFKENCPDSRNSKVVDILRAFEDFGITPQVHDPVVLQDEVTRDYGITLTDASHLQPADVIVLAVAHDVFKDTYQQLLHRYLKPGGLVIDLKGVVDRPYLERHGIGYWRL